jgi:hypothetical protein
VACNGTRHSRVPFNKSSQLFHAACRVVFRPAPHGITVEDWGAGIDDTERLVTA